MASDMVKRLWGNVNTRMADRRRAEDSQLMGEADLYRKALEKSAYGDASSQYGAGLDQISAQLAGMGPLADSGAATALRAKLASNLIGGAQSRIGSNYADFLRQSLGARQQYRYQRALAKYQADQAKKGGGGLLGTLGGIAGAGLGFVTGGPAGAVTGYGVGSNLAGRGGNEYATLY